MNEKTFKIGNIEFGIENIVFEIDAEESVISKLEIYGNKEIFDKISDDENNEWNWGLYPPKIYFWNVPFEKINGNINVEINEDLLDNCDIALYFVEHFDFLGNLSIENNNIEISGIVNVNDKENIMMIKTPVSTGIKK